MTEGTLWQATDLAWQGRSPNLNSTSATNEIRPLTTGSTAAPAESESTSTRLLREANLLWGGISSGFGQRLDQAGEHKWETGLAVAGSLALGAGLAFAQRRAGLWGLGAEIVGTALAGSFALDVASRISPFCGAVSDTWTSGARFDANKDIIANTAGTMAFDATLMGLSGMAGAGIARSTFAPRLPMPFERPVLQSAGETSVTPTLQAEPVPIGRVRSRATADLRAEGEPAQAGAALGEPTPTRSPALAEPPATGERLSVNRTAGEIMSPEEKLTASQLETTMRLVTEGVHRITSGQLTAAGNARVYASGDAMVVARENAFVRATGRARIQANGNANINAAENARVFASDDSIVHAADNAEVWAARNANVKADGNANITAHDNTRVTAYGRSNVEAGGNAQVYATDNSQISATDDVRVEAAGKAYVTLRGAAHVDARGNATVVAGGMSTADLRGNASATVGDRATANIFERSSATASNYAVIHAYDRAVARGELQSHLYLHDHSSGTIVHAAEAEGFDNARIVAREVSAATARGNSHVIAWDDADVLAYDRSRVIANDRTNVNLSDFAWADATHSATIQRSSPNARLTYGRYARLTVPTLKQNTQIELFKETDPVARGYGDAYDKVVHLDVTTPSQDRFQGSGFYINDTGELATAMHVIKGADSEITVTHADGTTGTATVLRVDPEMDLAILQSDRVVDGFRLAPSSTTLPSGAKVLVMGHPNGVRAMHVSPGELTTVAPLDQFVSEKTVSDLADEILSGQRLDLTAQSRPGNSGGPIINQDTGDVIGVVNRGGEEAQRTLGIPIERLRRLLAIEMFPMSTAQPAPAGGV
jgi:S1-C subfamily serine protease